MKFLNISKLIYNTFFELSLSKKKRNMIVIAVMYLLNVCFNGRYIGTSDASTLRKLFYDRIRYTIRKTSMIHRILILYYQKFIIKFMSHLSSITGLQLYLIVDDTFVEKDSRSVHIVKGGKKRKKEGFSLLTMIIVVGSIEIPLLVKPCYREVISKKLGILYLSKIDKAEYYIRLFYNLGLNKANAIVLLDSWYTCNRILHLVRNELSNMRLIGALRRNRLLNGKRIENYTMTHISESETRENYYYELCIQTGNLNKLNNSFSVLISKRQNLLDFKCSYRYIICSDLDLTAVEILHHYRNRWRIEVFHRIFKYRFSPEKWRFYSIDKGSNKSKNNLISITSISNLCCLCTISLGIAVRYTVSQFSVNDIVNANLEESFISYSLSYIKPILILENSKYESLSGKL